MSSVSVMDDPFIIGGTIVSDVMAASKWIDSVNDALAWQERDLVVDRKWLKLAVKEGVLNGCTSDYLYANQRSVSSFELERKAEVMFALNTQKQVKYRITIGNRKRLGVLMKKTDQQPTVGNGS